LASDDTDRASVPSGHGCVDRGEVRVLTAPDALHPWSIEDRGVLTTGQSVRRADGTLVAGDEVRDLPRLVEVDEHLHRGDRLGPVKVAGRCGEGVIRHSAST